MDSRRRPEKTALRGRRTSLEAPVASTPEWLEQVRVTIQAEPPIIRTLMIRAINAVLKFSDLSEASAIDATAAPTDLTVLLRALASGEVLGDLRTVEPLAPAFIRGVEARRRLLDENGGTLTAQEVGDMLGITRQAVEKRRTARKLVALNTGRHGYRYPAWQFTSSGSLRGLEEVLRVLAPHDEWMQVTFFVSRNPRLDEKTPIEMLQAGELRKVLNAAQVYGEHGAA